MCRRYTQTPPMERKASFLPVASPRCEIKLLVVRVDPHPLKIVDVPSSIPALVWYMLSIAVRPENAVQMPSIVALVHAATALAQIQSPFFTSARSREARGRGAEGGLRGDVLLDPEEALGGDCGKVNPLATFVAVDVEPWGL